MQFPLLKTKDTGNHIIMEANLNKSYQFLHQPVQASTARRLNKKLCIQPLFRSQS